MTKLQVPAVDPSAALAELAGSAGEPIAETTMVSARNVLAILERLDAPSPFVFPTSIGGIQFEWRGGPRELAVEVVPDERKLAYVTFRNGICQTESDANATEADLRAILNWLN